MRFNFSGLLEDLHRKSEEDKDPEYLVFGIRKPNGKVKVLKFKFYKVNNTNHIEVNDKESKLVNHPDTKILNYMLV